MKTVEIDVKRFEIQVAGETYEADAYITLKSDVSGEQMGLTWLACHNDHNVQGTICQLPYIVIDHESSLTLDQFIGFTKPIVGEAPKPAGYD
jgi:hypothetical protein